MFFFLGVPPKKWGRSFLFLGGRCHHSRACGFTVRTKRKVTTEACLSITIFSCISLGCLKGGGIFPTKSDPQNQRLWVATVGDLGDFPFPDFRIFGFIPSFRDADWRVPHDRKVDHLDLDSDWPSEADYCCTQSKAHWPSSLKEST